MAKIPCDRTEYGLTFLAPKVLTTHDIITVVVVGSSNSGGNKFFFTKFRQDSHYLINHRFFRIFSSPVISRRLSKNLGTISKGYLIVVGHVKRRGSQAPLLRSPPRQMNLYRSTPYILWPNSPSPLTDDWKVTDNSSINFHDVFFFIFCYNLAKNKEKHGMKIYG